MKTTFNIFGILTLTLLIASCSSSRPIMDDNVYMMKTPAVPIGENLLDETSYSTYKYREDMNNPTTGYYNPNKESSRNNNRSFSNFPVYYYYGMMYPGGNIGFGNSMYYNPYSFYSPYGFNHNMSFYGSNPSFYTPYFGYGSYFTGMNGFSNFSGSNSSPGLGNFKSGPRATSSGYYTGVSRGGVQQLKTPIQSTNENAIHTAGLARSSAPEMSRTRTINNAVISRQPQYSQRAGVTRNRTEPVRYNNQQARPVQSRENTVTRTSNPNTSRPATVNPIPRSNSIPSRSGATSSPSRSAPSSPRTGGGRRN